MRAKNQGEFPFPLKRLRIYLAECLINKLKCKILEAMGCLAMVITIMQDCYRNGPLYNLLQLLCLVLVPFQTRDASGVHNMDLSSSPNKPVAFCGARRNVYNG